MDDSALHQFENAAICLLCLHLSLCEDEDFHNSRMQDYVVLSDWLIADKKQIMMSLADAGCEELWFPDTKGPDICSTCYHWFGHTLGGRLRQGCIHCRDNTSSLLFFLSALPDYLYVNAAHCEYLIAEALFIWSKAKERKPQRTYKWLRTNGEFITQHIAGEQSNANS